MKLSVSVNTLFLQFMSNLSVRALTHKIMENPCNLVSNMLNTQHVSKVFNYFGRCLRDEKAA
jgi:hypothetical protein